MQSQAWTAHYESLSSKRLHRKFYQAKFSEHEPTQASHSQAAAMAPDEAFGIEDGLRPLADLRLRRQWGKADLCNLMPFPHLP